MTEELDKSTRSSPIRACFTGRKTAGTWRIRGEQIASRRSNWVVAQHLDDSEIAEFDIFCFVKKPILRLMQRLHKHKKLIVFDVVDSWKQPDDGLACLGVQAARVLFRNKWAEFPPIHSFIFPTRTMQEHLGPLVPHHSYIYHHYFPGLPQNTVRKEAHTLGYQGNLRYLGHWAEIIEDICRRKGLRFITDPAYPAFDVQHFAEIDIGFAARGGVHASFLASHYKSNVKLANLYGSGTPCVVSAKEVAYQETDNGYVKFFRTPEQLEKQIDEMLPYEARKSTSEAFLATAPTYHIDRIADLYEYYFLSVAEFYAQRGAA